ncbi:uncharacterized protein TNCV_2740581 [Trichonephila clavipes]|nr:uncharacterized protein TNCV_2740581 [Trichonephila clavipes]
MAAYVMGAAIPNVLQPGALIRFEKTDGPLVKVLPVPGRRPMKKLAVRVHFLRWGGLLDDWSVEDVLSLDTGVDLDMLLVQQRTQFPVKLAYVMTINKSQGQSFETVSLSVTSKKTRGIVTSVSMTLGPKLQGP